MVITLDRPYTVIIDGREISARDRKIQIGFLSHVSAMAAAMSLTVEVQRINPDTMGKVIPGTVEP